MPMHDWTRVPDGIYHAFHHNWISAITDVLNNGRLPDDCYALPERVFSDPAPDDAILSPSRFPQTRLSAESESDIYRRKKNSIAVQDSRDDRMTAVVDIVLPSNKSNRHALGSFVNTACKLIGDGVHVTIISPIPPTPIDPDGVHAPTWREFETDSFEVPPTATWGLVAYASGTPLRAYGQPIRVGDSLPEIPLFLRQSWYIVLPVEDTYRTAFASLPRRWRRVLE